MGMPRAVDPSFDNPINKPTGDDPKHTIIVYSDDGQYYLISRSDWGQPIPMDDPTLATVRPLAEGGAYLAYRPPPPPQGGPKAGGIGTACTIVNLKSILKNNP